MIAGVISKGVPYAAGGAHIGVAAIAALRYAQSDGVDLVMPVRPVQQIFASFRHIQLRPDSRLQDGVPLYKLRILDSLIDHLSRTEGAGATGATEGSRAAAGAGAGRRGLSAAGVDRAIESLQELLRHGRRGGAAYRFGTLPEPGAFVNLVA
jgi:hypothetical protein